MKNPRISKGEARIRAEINERRRRERGIEERRGRALDETKKTAEEIKRAGSGELEEKQSRELYEEAERRERRREIRKYIIVGAEAIAFPAAVLTGIYILMRRPNIIDPVLNYIDGLIGKF